MQRTIRYPTDYVSVQLSFPPELDPRVWGVESSLSETEATLRSAIEQREEDGRRLFTWSVDRPAHHTRFRFEWRFDNGEDDELLHLAPSDRMRQLGVVQEGNEILARPAEAFELPAEADAAAELRDKLIVYVEPITAVHSFGKGVGLAAPQIGVAKAAALVRLPDSDPVVLFNPRIVDASTETDEQYEGCLSVNNEHVVPTRAG